MQPDLDAIIYSRTSEIVYGQEGWPDGPSGETELARHTSLATRDAKRILRLCPLINKPASAPLARSRRCTHTESVFTRRNYGQG